MKKELVLDIIGMTLCGLAVLFEITDTIINLVTGCAPSTTTTAHTIFLLCGLIICLLTVHAIELKNRWRGEKNKEGNDGIDK